MCECTNGCMGANIVVCVSVCALCKCMCASVWVEMCKDRIFTLSK